MSGIVRAEGLEKSYGRLKALDGAGLSVAPGSICGLIGPNGAGKTTLLKALVGLCDVDGELSVAGRDPRRSRSRLMRDVCFIADVGILPRWMKVSWLLDYAEAAHPRFSRERAEAFLGATDIPRGKRVKALSKGMIAQLHLALVMAIDVRLLVLDEPTLGLDIVYRKEFYDRLMNEYYDGDCSIIVSTHQVEEIETLLSHLVFIDRGRIVLDAAMADLPDVYTEVLVAPGMADRARSLGPIHERELLGRTSCIYESVARAELEPLGELHTPKVADLFVAKMGAART